MCLPCCSMARKQNLKNLKTEKDGLDVLHEKLAGFVVPTSEERRHLYAMCNIDYKRYSRSVDGVLLFVDCCQGQVDIFISNSSK